MIIKETRNQPFYSVIREYSSFTNTSISSRPARRWVIPPFFITASNSFAFLMTSGFRLQEAATWVISWLHIAVLFWWIRRCSSYPWSFPLSLTLPQAKASLLNLAQISHTSLIRVCWRAEHRVTWHFQNGALGRCNCTARRFSASDRAATLYHQRLISATTMPRDHQPY